MRKVPTSPSPDQPLSATAALPAIPPLRSRDHPVELKVRMEFVRLAYHNLEAGAVAIGVVALAYAVGLSFIVSDLTPWAWLGCILLMCGAQVWLARSYRSKEHGPADSSQWGLRFVVVTSTVSLGFGLLVWIFPPLGAAPFSTGHILLLAGVTIGKSQLMLPMRKGNLVHLFCVMSPLALCFLLSGDSAGTVLGVCAVIFILFAGTASLRSQRMLSNALVLRFEREALAAELAAENSRREAHEVEMKEARDKAESANRAKDDFIATISHEIRTPMNGVLGMLRVVRDTEMTKEQRSYLRTASDSAEALLLLLNDVLDFSKIEAGRLELERAPFPPATVAKGVTDLLHARARDKGLQFELRIADNLPGVIIADQGRLRQILVNLIGNAIKFTEKGKVELTVKCVERTENKAVMHFVVTDTGIGIDSSALERLFKPFTQADSSMSRKYGGTGLGLVISMRLAQAMGGIIQVQSSHGRGSTFQLVLPCPLPEVGAEASRAVETPKFVPPLLRGHVLVVEDDSVNRQVIELFLKKLGLTAMFAVDGEIAITTATTQPFDLVLMDCQLPGIDGLEATRQIRKILQGRPLLIIALTANASTQVRENCLAAGMNDFLSKPVRFELLAGLLAKHLPPA